MLRAIPLSVAAVLAFHSAPAAQSLDAEAGSLIARARANHFTGNFSADVIGVRDSYLRGADSLRGRMDFRDAQGERRLLLRGRESFEWWSRFSGGEHWIQTGASRRLRRIPPHSLRKPALESPVSFEDLAHFPFGYLEGFRSARSIRETDSTYEVTLVPRPGQFSRYSALQVSLGKSPVLLRRVSFLPSAASQPAKVMELAGYRPQGGGYFPSEMRMVSGDGLSSFRLLFTPARTGVAQDKTYAFEGVPFLPDPRWEARDPLMEGEEQN